MHISTNFHLALLTLSVLCLSACSWTSGPCGDPASGQSSPVLAERLETWRAQHDLPALGAALLHADGHIEVAAVGWRQAGADACVTPEDCFHLGSCGKAMTATMLGVLVDGGELSWDATLGQVFTDLAAQMHPDFQRVTLVQLLTHRAGLPDDREDSTTQSRIEAGGGTLTEKRLAMVRTRTSVAPIAAPGTAYQYSNAGYEIAAAMAERATGQTYEDLMRARLFEPLGMTSAGFGAPGTAGIIDAPRGHTTVFGAAVAVPPGPTADNPLFTAPSGGIHCSLADWARFAAAHLTGAGGGGDWLRPATWTTLHTPPAGDYACGWMVLDDSPLGRALFHDGGNTMWYAVIYLLPESNTAVLVTTNRGDVQHAEPVVEVINTLATEISVAGD